MMADTDKDQVKLRKPVKTLVMIPMAGKISVVARKLYNVVLHSTSSQIKEYELKTGNVVPYGHYFESRLVDLLQPIQTGQSDLRARAKEYFREMAEIRIEWEAPDNRDEQGDDDDEQDDWVNIGLLSEARLRKASPGVSNSEVIARWALPPGIFRQLRNPQDYKYAQLSLYQIAKLDTYEAVALYEICARYRNNPSGVTSKQEPIWWIKALSNKVPPIDPATGLPKWREWRKFKDEKVKKAVAEICDQTDLDIEMIEKGGQVQFAVRRKAAEFAPLPNKLNPEIADKALGLGLKLTDIATLLRNGQSEVGLKEALARMAKQDMKKIDRKFAYLLKILEEVNPLISDGAPIQTTGQQEVLPRVTNPTAGPAPFALTYKEERRAEIRKEFLLLDKAEQQPFAYLALVELKAMKLASPTLSVKVEAKAWETAPLLFSKMVEIFAAQQHGAQWAVDPVAN
jgi:hypothetical protein